MNSDHPAAASGFVLADDEGPAFWFLNTLTINKWAAATATAS